MISINANDYILLKLTARGMAIMREDHQKFRDEVPSVHEFVPPAVDHDGYTRMQIWNVMNTFGPHIYMGCEMPFNTEMRIVHGIYVD